MSRIERLLRQLTPTEPSSGYLSAGLSRIEARSAQRSESQPAWRYATIGLAILLTASMALNAALWRAAVNPPDVRHPPARYLAYSVLRAEGDLLVRETRYEVAVERKTSDD